MTDEEKLALKAVLTLAVRNVREREGGFYFNKRTHEMLSFNEAIRIIAEMLLEGENDD